MIPLRHARGANGNSENERPPLALTRKQDRPSMKSRFPYNGSADYYCEMPPPLDFAPRQPVQRRFVPAGHKLAENPRLDQHFKPTPPSSHDFQSISMMPPPSQPPRRNKYPQPSYNGQQSFVYLAGKPPLLPYTESANKDSKSKRYLKIALIIIAILVGLYFATGLFGGSGNDQSQERTVDNQFKTDDFGFEMNSPNEQCGGSPCEESVVDTKLNFVQVTQKNMKEGFKDEMKTKVSTAEKPKVVYSWDEDAESTIEVLAD